MRSTSLRLASAFSSLPALAVARTVGESVDSWFALTTGWFVGFIFSSFPGTDIPWIMGWLVAAATVFSLCFGFIQVRAFGHAIALVSGRYSDPRHLDEISHFQALTTALSGTVGLGNIAGVAVAVSIGGACATGGAPITSAAFGSAFTWAPFALSLAVILFAFSTIITWGYYGVKAWTYLFGEGAVKEQAFKVIFCLFMFIGAVSGLEAAINFSDAAILAMALVNFVALYLLMPVVKRGLQGYLDRLGSGQVWQRWGGVAARDARGFPAAQP